MNVTIIHSLILDPFQAGHHSEGLLPHWCCRCHCCLFGYVAELYLA